MITTPSGLRIRPGLPEHLTKGFPATAGPLNATPPRKGQGNCAECRGSGESPAGRQVLFCDACGGTGDYSGGPRRVTTPEGTLTLYGPVPTWIKEMITAAA